MKGHCRDGFCSTTYRMGGCECDCEMCMEAMMKPDEPELRGYKPVEVLEKVTGPKSHCPHCTKGVIEIMRDTKTMALRWDVVYCMLCGQRYNIKEEDRQKFIGYDYTQELFGKEM